MVADADQVGRMNAQEKGRRERHRPHVDEAEEADAYHQKNKGTLSEEITQRVDEWRLKRLICLVLRARILKREEDEKTDDHARQPGQDKRPAPAHRFREQPPDGQPERSANG